MRSRPAILWTCATPVPVKPLLHATFRQNYGINRQLVGRDHAGVGDFYGMFEAQEIFDKIPMPAEEGKRLLCEPMKIDWTFYCKKCDGMASMRTCPPQQGRPRHPVRYQAAQDAVRRR